MLKMLKEINKTKDKTYTNYFLVINVGEKNYKVAIQPKTFGKDWTHPSVRQSFTMLDLVSEIVVKGDNTNGK